MEPYWFPFVLGPWLATNAARPLGTMRSVKPEDEEMPHIKRRIVSLLTDDQLDDSEKIAVLRQLEMDSLAKERSATEGLIPVDGDDGEDLKAIEQALRKLGAQPIEGGPASL
jgi:predicted dinucleotide-binding enzyme